MLSGKGLLINISINTKTIRPPSRTGIGSKFSIPKLILINAMNDKVAIKPHLATVPASLAIPTGPLKFLPEICPVTIFPNIFSVNTII